MSSTKTKTPWLDETRERFTKLPAPCKCGQDAKPKRKMVVLGPKTRMSLNVCSKCKGVVR